MTAPNGAKPRGHRRTYSDRLSLGRIRRILLAVFALRSIVGPRSLGPFVVGRLTFDCLLEATIAAVDGAVRLGRRGDFR